MNDPYGPGGEDMSDEADDLKNDIAASVQEEFGDFGIGSCMEDDMMGRNPMVTVELIENGMLVRYFEPVEKMFQPGPVIGGLGRRQDQSMVEIFFGSIISALQQAAEEVKTDESKKRFAIIAKSITEAMDKLKPKAEKRWMLESRTVAAKTGDDLMKAISRAEEAKKKTDELERQGHRVYGGPYSYGSPVLGQAAPLMQGRASEVF